MFDTLSENFKKTIKSLRGLDRITESNIISTTQEIKRSLIHADVHYQVAKQFTKSIKAKAIGKRIITSVSPGQLFTKLVQDELTQLMGATNQSIRLHGSPAIVLLMGLQGVGKTTLAAKLALLYKKQNKRPCLVACDVYRPAAAEQLRILGQQHDIAVYTELDQKDPSVIACHALEYAKTELFDLLIVDTAGRSSNDQALMQEIVAIKQRLNPSETLLVVDAMVGQEAINMAKAFQEQVDFDGVILTKMDGDARGGVALSIRSVLDKPIKLLSTGEHIVDLEVFYPDRMASRILGMGDVVSLVEKAERLYDQAQAKQLRQKLDKQKFDFNDFLQQIQQLKKLGGIKDILAMLPDSIVGRVKVDMEKDPLREYEVMISSMTPKERANPDILDQKRQERISKGSGMPLESVREKLKQFQSVQKALNKAHSKHSKGAWDALLKKFRPSK